MFSISCKRASELVHKKHNEGLTTKERWRLKIHTGMCSACKTFEKQTDQIEKIVKSRIQKQPSANLEDFKVDTLSKINK
ncbi:MAG: hypothetical protein KC517_02565 [Bacteroidetes bacterium]|jgi:hypothetical protein|nr:hypothetical protein [Bacteroidota bacterium]